MDSFGRDLTELAKQGKLVCDMIDHGLVQSIVATGALIAHGLTESIGLTHYRYDPTLSDQMLFERGYNRVYDTLEMESKRDPWRMALLMPKGMQVR